MSTRILISDDNPTFRKTLRQLLEAVEQWEIIETRDGEEAVRKALETRPNLIVLDLAMPVKNGLAAAREISQALPETPILLCTMYASVQLEIEAQKSGIHQIISKSESNVIVPAIQQLLANAPVPSISVAPPIALLDTVPTLPPAQISDTSLPIDPPPSPSDPGTKAS